MKDKNISFFQQFDVQQILTLWNECDTLYDIAVKLDYKKQNIYFKRIDYEYIKSILTRENGSLYINKNKKRQRQRYKIIKDTLSKKVVLDIINVHQIETLGHLSIYFLVSFTKVLGRSFFRNIIKNFDIELNDKLYKSVNLHSKEPFTWPTKYFENRVGLKPSICNFCGFKVNNPKQMELHHSNQQNIGPKKKRNKEYYTSKQLEPLCANCHRNK